MPQDNLDQEEFNRKTENLDYKPAKGSRKRLEALLKKKEKMKKGPSSKRSPKGPSDFMGQMCKDHPTLTPDKAAKMMEDLDF